MGTLNFIDKLGTFTLDDPDLTSYMYFPLANEAGMMSAITPDLSGDIKLDQNSFLLEPVSCDNLHNNKSSRNRVFTNFIIYCSSCSFGKTFLRKTCKKGWI